MEFERICRTDQSRSGSKFSATYLFSEVAGDFLLGRLLNYLLK